MLLFLYPTLLLELHLNVGKFALLSPGAVLTFQSVFQCRKTGVLHVEFLFCRCNLFQRVFLLLAKGENALQLVEVLVNEIEVKNDCLKWSPMLP